MKKQFIQLAVSLCPVLSGLLGYRVPSVVGILIMVLGSSVVCALLIPSICAIVAALLTIGGFALMLFSQGDTLLL